MRMVVWVGFPVTCALGHPVPGGVQRGEASWPQCTPSLSVWSGTVTADRCKLPHKLRIRVLSLKISVYIRYEELPSLKLNMLVNRNTLQPLYSVKK